MKLLVLFLSSTLLGGTSAFAPGAPRLAARKAFALHAFTEADDLMYKMMEGASSAPPPPAPVVQAVVEAAPKVVEKVAEPVAAPAAVEAVSTSLPEVSIPDVSVPDLSGIDVPLPVIAGIGLAVVAAAVLLGGGGDDESPAPAAPTPAPAPVAAPAPAPAASSVDISVPYDAAAMLAYEAAGKPGDFDSFKASYVKEAVATVVAKKKARES